MNTPNKEPIEQLSVSMLEGIGVDNWVLVKRGKWSKKMKPLPHEIKLSLEESIRRGNNKLTNINK